MNPETIRQTREAHGLSVGEAARMVQVTDRTWRRWEDGSRKMPAGAWELFQIKVRGNRHEPQQ